MKRTIKYFAISTSVFLFTILSHGFALAEPKTNNKLIEVSKSSNEDNLLLTPLKPYSITDPFCQLYTTRFNFWRMSLEIIKFSTFKLGPCLDDMFARITVASALAQLKTIASTTHVYKNGPSYFTMDSNLSPLNREFVSIGSLRFFAQTIVYVSVFDLLFNSTFSKKGIPVAYFTPFIAHEDIYYIWDKGSTIFILIPPDKKSFYVMTNYSTMVDPELDKSNIAEKIGQLPLPKGWLFESRVLEKQLIVRTVPVKDFTHKVIFDQLQNFYHFVE